MQLLLNFKGRRRRRPLNLKFFLAMKMLSLLLTVACLELGARGYSQQITISLKNASLEKVFRQIERQTPFRFLYSKEAMYLTHPITIEVKNETLETVLRICFNGQPIAYSIEDKFIIIKIAEEKKTGVELFHDVKGRVVNENGEGVIVTVTEKGTMNAASTDADGYFLLKDIDKDATLVITGVNIETYEIKVNSKMNLGIL